MNGAETERPALTIGVRDSGVGGLTVARCLKAAIPGARLLYFADTAHVPYGERSGDEVRHYALSISRFLIERGAQIVVFACNTSSALALDTARDRFAAPIVGMIEPGARAALGATQSGKIGVLATRATVASGVYSQWLRRLSPEVAPFEIACPEFVPLVEAEKAESAAAHAAAREYLAPLLAAGVDTVVLGCTHYPLLLGALRRAAPGMSFIDPAEAVAEAVQAEIAAAGLDTGRYPDGVADAFFASGESQGVARWAAKLLERDEPEVQPGPVFDLLTEPELAR